MLTAVSCRANAAVDRSQAAAAALANQSIRFNASADAWDERAEMLERIGRLTTARRQREADDRA
jgi:hypothetical protein